MKAIYKKELRIYMSSMLGFVFIFFILLVCGIYYTFYNISYAYPGNWSYHEQRGYCSSDCGAYSEYADAGGRKKEENRSASFNFSCPGPGHCFWENFLLWNPFFLFQ